jgi:hypothetical protein
MSNSNLPVLPPILRDKHYDAPSTFTPDSLLREARRQKNVPHAPVPEVCVLDPDGDIVRHLRATGRARRTEGWACYHSEMDSFDEGGREYGIVGCAVGAPYAVLLSEQMFASGCRLLISITSGQIRALRTPPYFILIERAARRRRKPPLLADFRLCRGRPRAYRDNSSGAVPRGGTGGARNNLDHGCAIL